MLAVTLAACGGSKSAEPANESSGTTGNSANGSKEAGPEQEKVEIIITNGKGEIASQWEQAAKDFMAANPNITVVAQSAAVGDTLSILDKLTASGETVTIAMLEPSGVLNKYKNVNSFSLSRLLWQMIV